ncbi:MAG: hypothetical protein AB7R55_22460 [Gemmatimonadales bacterium]
MDAFATLSATTSHLARPAILAVSLTVLSGLADAYGFVHASRIWRGDVVHRGELGHTFLGFGLGMLAHLLALRYLSRVGITLPEVQAIVWFTVVIVGVAMLNRTFVDWAGSERLVALGVACGLGWLLVRTGG